MTYSVKEIFYSLQGEGAHCGRPAIFCRFAGCNLWSGREQDRASAQCTFCDTDFVGVNGLHGAKYATAAQLVDKIVSLWPKQSPASPYIVCTGGEPLLQLDDELINALHSANCIIAVETNGTIAVPSGVDWICVSPKGATELQQRMGDELKLIYPQREVTPQQYSDLQFTHWYLQPMDGDNYQENLQQTIDYCLRYPQWCLSLQTHKIVGIM